MPSQIQILQQREACHTQHLSRSRVIWRRNIPGCKRCLSHRVWTMRSVSHGHPIMQRRRGASHLKWAYASRPGSLHCNPQTCHEDDSGHSGLPQSRSDPSHSCWPATVCSTKTNPVGVARVWRGQVCHNVWGLHIEMAALKSLGTLLEDSGWTSAIVEAGLASSGTAESFLTASSVTKTRQTHQITACNLYKLMRGAYEDYCSE